LSKERVFSSSGESHGVSRSIGDRGAARACVATPDFKNTILSASGGGRIVIASDGVWDCYSSQKAMATIKGVSKVDTAAKKMCVAAREKREYGGFSMDDISVIVVDVGKWKPSSGGEGKQPGGCSCVVQ
jgi:serine/threonine protein phosphatase PrpC